MKRSFKLLAGSHDEHGKMYNTGDVVESSHDLAKIFAFKFVEVTSAQPAKTAAKVVETPDEREDEGADGETAETAPSALGEEVTEAFAEVAGDKYRVFRKGKNHFVASVGAPDESLAEEPMTAKQVKAFIKSL